MRAEAVGPAVEAGIDLAADGSNWYRPLATEATPVTLAGVFLHSGGKLHVEVATSARDACFGGLCGTFREVRFNRHRRGGYCIEYLRSKLSLIGLDA